MKGSLIIAAVFVAGTLFGAFGVFRIEPGSDSGFWVLCALMFCVGVSIGCDSGVLRSFRSISPRLMLLPLATVAGTLAACGVAGPLLTGRSLTDCMAVGSGFGYYSLSAIFITEYRGPELGTVALLSNVVRELTALLCAPVLARWAGKLAPIAVGGATTMDTTLPVILQTSGRSFAALSVFHGFAVDFSVPFLVTLFCKI